MDSRTGLARVLRLMGTQSGTSDAGRMMWTVDPASLPRDKNPDKARETDEKFISG